MVALFKIELDFVWNCFRLLLSSGNHINWESKYLLFLDSVICSIKIHYKRILIY